MLDKNTFFTNTFSIAGRCKKTNAFGAIVTTSSPAVGARVIKCKSGTGVVLSQNMTDPRLADIGISILDKGYDAESAVQAMKAASKYTEYRQLAAIDNNGNSYAFTGKKAFGPYNGDFCSKDVVSIGNYLCTPGIPEAMAKRFIETEELSLPERLLTSIEVGFQMGGEVGLEHSIALIVYTDTSFPYVDLRVDYSDHPFQDMERLWDIWSENADKYKQYALNPTLLEN